MEHETLSVYERALLLLRQERLRMNGIEADLKVIREDGSVIQVPKGYNPATA